MTECRAWQLLFLRCFWVDILFSHQTFSVYSAKERSTNGLRRNATVINSIVPETQAGKVFRKQSLIRVENTETMLREIRQQKHESRVFTHKATNLQRPT